MRRRRSTIERGVRGACSVAAVWMSAAGSREHAFLRFQKLILETNKRHMQLSHWSRGSCADGECCCSICIGVPPPPPGVGRPAITP